MMLLLQFPIMVLMGECSQVATFLPGLGCGGSFEIKTVRDAVDVSSNTPCQLLSFIDQSDVIPDPNLSKSSPIENLLYEWSLFVG